MAKENNRPPVRYGTRDATYMDVGCGTPGLESCGCGFAGLLIFGVGSRFLGWWALAVATALCLFACLVTRVRVRVAPEGLTIARTFGKRFIPWTTITRAEDGLIWIGEERVSLPGWIDVRWDVKAILWKYLRHYAECPPPKRRKKKPRTSTDEETGQE